MELTRRRITIILAIAGAIIVGIIVISVINIIRQSKETASVHILVAPASSRIDINGKHYDNGNHNIEPGNYQAIISKDGFESQTINFSAKEGEQADVYAALVQTNGKTDWYDTHPEDAEIAHVVDEYYHDIAVTEFIERHPILNEFPITIDYYTANSASRVYYKISDTSDLDSDSVTIVIEDFTGNNYDKALEKIHSLGYDISSYKIQYIDKTSESKWGKAF